MWRSRFNRSACTTASTTSIAKHMETTRSRWRCPLALQRARSQSRYRMASIVILISMIQTALVNAGAYLIDANGDNVFFIQLIENSTYYSAQVDVSAAPTLIGTYTRPATGLYSSGGSGLPTTARVPRLVIDNAEFGKIIGFAAGQFPSASSTTPASFLSTLPPQINPVSAYVVRCSLVNNSFTAPPDILTVFTSQGTEAGQLISYQPNEFSWMKVNDGSYSIITITIVDQLERFVKFRDPNLLISLSFREAKK
jgi:hypothetical protein